MSYPETNRSTIVTQCIRDKPLRDESTAVILQPDPTPRPVRSLHREDLGQPDLSGVICHNYQLGRRLGSGGMGVVYHAQHQVLGKQFAIKFVAQQAGNPGELVKRFVQEMTAVGQLNHPHIVSATDAGEIDGIPYYVTELLEGNDLTHWIKVNGCADVGIACEMIRQSALGLEHAHRHGFLHRDIKPSNLFLESRGNIKLLDFGLVRSQQTASELTGTGQIMGTVDYCSPEQAEDCRCCTRASDIYSLGATFIYLLSGEPPYPDALFPSVVNKIRGHLTVRPPWLDQHAHELPSELVSLLDSMLAKTPSLRPESCERVAEQIGVWAKPFTGNHSLEPMERKQPQPRFAKRIATPSIFGLTAGSLAAVGVLALGLHHMPTTAPPDHMKTETVESESALPVSPPNLTDTFPEPSAMSRANSGQGIRSAGVLQLDTSAKVGSNQALDTMIRSPRN
jgi:serine/threonine protein kinase